MNETLARVGRGTALILVFATPACTENAPGPSAQPCSEVVGQAVPTAATAGVTAGAHTSVWDGVRFWYCVGGNASPGTPPLVFVHGGPGQGSQHFAALTGPSLEPEVQVVYFDQRGSGRSERPWNDDYSVPTLVEDLERLRTTLGVERISLLGHSFGGLLALEYAAAYPERVHRAVIVAGLSDVPATARAACDRLARLDPEAYARAMEQPLPGGICNTMSAYSGAERQAFDQASMFPDAKVAAVLDSVDRLDGLRNTGDVGRVLFQDPSLFSYRFASHGRVSVPVLVVAGRQDFQLGFEPQEALASDLPDGRLFVIEDGGHFPHLDDPEAFAAAVLSFLRAD